MTIATLIDKQDNLEVIRDQIAAILALESTAQQSLASGAGKDPDQWKLNVYTERSNPWEKWLNNPEVDEAPIVNVWVDTASYDPAGSNIVERQKTSATINIDCYGIGISQDDGNGHKPGDREAAFESQRAIRLVRNILMAAEYTYLGLRGLVWQRWPESLQIFQPAIDGLSAQQIVAGRLAFRVIFNEFSPQVVGDTLELLSVDVKRTEDGQIVAEADYSYTP